MSINSIAIVAHDNKKKELVEWVKKNIDTLSTMDIYATGTTGKLIANVFEDNKEINSLLSGPLGGDQQIGAKIAEGTIEMLIFFLGPSRGYASRPRYKSLTSHSSGVEYTLGLQSGKRRLSYSVSAH